MTTLRPLLLLLSFFIALCGPLNMAAQTAKSFRGVGKTTDNSAIQPIGQPTPGSSSTTRNAANTADTSATKKRKGVKGGDEKKGEPSALETNLFSAETKRQRIFSWQHNRYLNTLQIQPIDTLINDRFRDYPFLQHDVGASYLGTVGSAVVLHDYFKRQTDANFYYFSPYLEYATTPDNIKFYNTKTAYTRFEYTGTLFGNSAFEEGNVGILVSANMLPQWNWTTQYRHFGTRGLLQNEATDHNEFMLSTSYSGKRYNAHAGFIYNGWNNKENGGMVRDQDVLDTIIDVRVIDVSLTSAASKLNNYSFFITQTYAVPLNFFRKDSTLKDDGTAIYFGHAAEYTTISRVYSDQIANTDTTGRNFYRNAFFINPTTSRDSMRMALLDNKLFMTIQPWSSSFIVSKLTGGLGYSHISNYEFRPEFYLSPTTNSAQNNVYVYAAGEGVFSRYFNWSAFTRYDFIGYTQNDFLLDGQVGFAFYPLKQGVHFTGNFVLQTKGSDYFLNNTYSNHFVWQNNFDKTVETKLQVKVSIPDWQLEAGFNYSLLSKAVYFDTTATPLQNNGEVSILSGYLNKNFTIWLFHLDHRLLVQASSNQNVVPLPALSANLTYYLQGVLVKNVLTAQLGVDMYYHTAYNAYGYNPDAGAFHTQETRKIGNYPYMDAFVNMKWKRANIFLKVVNVAEGWPSSDYFSALHYIRSQRAFKLGISWSFY